MGAQEDILASLEDAVIDSAAADLLFAKRISETLHRLRILAVQHGLETGGEAAKALFGEYVRAGKTMIELQPTHWTVRNFHWRDELVDVDVSQALETDGENETQQGIVPSTEFYLAIWDNLYRIRNGVQGRLVEKVRGALGDLSVPLRTSTRVKYADSKFVHFEGVRELQRIVEAQFVSKEEEHKRSNEGYHGSNGFKHPMCPFLFGKFYSDRAHDLLEWVTRKESRVWFWNATNPPFYDLDMECGEFIALQLDDRKWAAYVSDTHERKNGTKFYVRRVRIRPQSVEWNG
jgi:hypothetical protein